MTTDPSTVDFHMDIAAASTMKALSSRLKKRAQAEYKQRIERLDNAIRSQSHRVQQQNTRMPVTCASQRQKYAGQPQVSPSETHADSTGSQRVIRRVAAKILSYGPRLVVGGNSR
jgi:hypothetical protein